MIQERLLTEHTRAIPPNFALGRSSAGTIHRCRLYAEEREVLPGKDFVIEVWDSTAKPCEGEGLPQGELMATFEGETMSEVREMVDNKLRVEGYPLTGCWNLRGSL